MRMKKVFNFFSLLFYSVPPDIINEESSADIAVQEGEDASLVCRATGHPPPRVTWRREDGETISLRKQGHGNQFVKRKLTSMYFFYEFIFTSHRKKHPEIMMDCFAYCLLTPHCLSYETIKNTHKNKWK